MASAGKNSQDTSKTKAPLTPEQRKLYTGLAAGGVILLLAGGLIVPRMMGGGPPEVPVSPPSTNTVSTPAPADDGAAPAPVAQTAGAPGTTTRPAQPLPSRDDPFQQLYFIPTPTPVPPPVPPPVSLPNTAEMVTVNLPGAEITRQLANQPLNLPPVAITRLDQASRRPVDAFPPPRGAGGEGGSGAATPSTNRRLSGIIIGDGVRALLEIQTATGVVTRVVQPGDETDGITVLSIQRVNEGTRIVPRMIIRENGEEKIVDLRAGAPVAPPGGVGIPGGPVIPGGGGGQ